MPRLEHGFSVRRAKRLQINPNQSQRSRLDAEVAASQPAPMDLRGKESKERVRRGVRRGRVRREKVRLGSEESR
jgi:hypothetical protein